MYMQNLRQEFKVLLVYDPNQHLSLMLSWWTFDIQYVLILQDVGVLVLGGVLDFAPSTYINTSKSP